MAIGRLKPGFVPVFLEYKGLITASFMLMVFSGFGQSVFFGIYLPDILKQFQIDKTTLGSIYAAATIASALLISWSAQFLDRIPLTRFLMAVLCGLALGCLLMAIASNLIMLFLAFLLLRQFGQGLMVLSGTTAINRYIEDGRGRAQSMANAGLPIHAAIFPIVGIIILDTVGYMQSWLFYGAFIMLVLLPFFLITLRHHESRTHEAWKKKIDEQEQTAKEENSTVSAQWTRKQVLQDWRFYLIMLVMIIPPCFGTAVFFYQSVLAEMVGITERTFAAGFIFMTATSVFGALLAGVLIDKYGESPVMITFPVFYALGLICLALAWSVPVLYFGLMCVGLGGGMMSITGGPLFAKMYGTKYYGSIKSLSVIAMILASAVSPPLTGFFLDAGTSISEIFIYFSTYSLFAWFVLLLTIKNILTIRGQS